MAIERRINLRLPVVWKATITRLNGEQIPGSTDNVARDGLNVILSKSIGVGESVTIDLVTKCAGQTCYFRMQGITVYIDPLQNNLGIAVGVALQSSDQRFEALVIDLESKHTGLSQP